MYIVERYWRGGLEEEQEEGEEEGPENQVPGQGEEEDSEEEELREEPALSTSQTSRCTVV